MCDHKLALLLGDSSGNIYVKGERITFVGKVHWHKGIDWYKSNFTGKAKG